MNIWQQLAQQEHKAIGLSPMDGQTDAAFRFIISKYCKPDVIFTEFVNVDSIYHSREESLMALVYHKQEKPIIAQIFGVDPKLFYLAAQIVAELGFDGLDINMGCPSKNVSSRGAGAGLIKTPELALEIVAAAKQGIADWVESGLSEKHSKRAVNKLIKTKEILKSIGNEIIHEERNIIPVSVKTRIGYSENEIATWIPKLLESNPANISLHGRTFKQLYSGLADWQAIAEAAKIVATFNENKEAAEKITIWGNGDIKSYEQAQEYAKKCNLDGILIGRAVLGAPWIMSPEEMRPKNLKQQLPIILEHAQKFEELFPTYFYAMRKHLAWYFKGFDGASALRSQLVQTNNYQEVENIISECKNLTR